MSKYIEVSSGAALERRPGMFFFRGQYFSGLVSGKALYSDPEDSFCEAVKLPCPLQTGLIRPVVGAEAGP